MSYIIYTKAMPTPRPRSSKWGVYTPSKYREYLKELSCLIRDLSIPERDYTTLNVKFYFKYPVSTPRYKLVEASPHRIKFDCDNLVKGFMDALSYAGVFKNDSQVSSVCVSKLYTTSVDRIEFELF